MGPASDTPLRAATRLVSARWVVPIERPVIDEGGVALAGDGTIVEVGPRSDLRAAFPNLPEERARGALIPGLVNAHCHLELSALTDTVPGGAGLVAWTAQVMRAWVSREARREAARDAAAAAVRLGTAAMGDVGNTLDAVPALGAAGLGGVFFHELLGSRDASTGDALADATRERTAAEAAGEAWPAALAYVRAPHAPYSASRDLLRRLFAAAAAEHQATSIHVAEDEDEIHLLRDGTGAWPAVLAALGVDPATRVPGQSPVTYLASVGAFDGGPPPLLVHMVHAGDEDRRIARDAGATVVLCPRSNLHIGGRLPDVPALVADDVDLALGTDSLASAPDLSLFGEMATLSAHFPALPAARVLAAATEGGARALGRGDLGSLSPGKRPGVLDVWLDDVTAPLESLVRVSNPTLRWVARAAEGKGT